MIRAPSRPGCVFDPAVRAALWCAYRILLAWWFVARPQHHGAVIAIWLDGRILMIRHSYRNRLSWPGGGVRRGEDPAAAAIRELHEELGFAVDRNTLSFAEKILERWEYRYDHVWIFELHLTAPPALAPDGREVIGACFMNPADALAENLTPFIQNYLRQRPGPLASV
jgi:8-oxo-dGTP diphosphatase